MSKRYYAIFSLFSNKNKAGIVTPKRPMNLNLWTLKFPPMAIVSIFHRISGVIIFLLLPFMLYLLQLSLKSSASFDDCLMMLSMIEYKFLVWVFLAAFFYHLIAGIRHLMMDLGFGESLNAGRISAILVMLLGVVMTILVGVWLW